MNASQERDEWLMAQVALGMRDCMEPLVRRHATPLLSFIHRLIGDRHRSEELFQEVFLAVWVKRKQYQFPRAFKTWLYAIAINKCRASFRRRTHLVIALEPEPAATSSDETPSKLAIASETAALVTNAVTQLPAQQRVVIVLRIWENQSYAQIAEILGRTEATVRSHMHHGLASLRKYLEPRLR